MTFWKYLEEMFLEAIFGEYQLKIWREEKAERKKCEEAFKKQQEYFEDIRGNGKEMNIQQMYYDMTVIIAMNIWFRMMMFNESFETASATVKRDAASF